MIDCLLDLLALKGGNTREPPLSSRRIALCGLEILAGLETSHLLQRALHTLSTLPLSHGLLMLGPLLDVEPPHFRLLQDLLKLLIVND